MQETTPGPSADKSEWRRWLRGALAKVAEPAVQSRRIRDHLASILASLPDSRIAFFSALPDEPDLMDLPGICPGHRWALPRVEGDQLVFHEVDHRQSHRSGAFGIAEPSTDLPVITPGSIDLFLCPGMGFTPSGIRLGRGKGFYDRALAAAKPDALFLGIAYREQVVSQLPADPHDMRMHRLVSPDGTVDC